MRWEEDVLDHARVPLLSRSLPRGSFWDRRGEFGPTQPWPSELQAPCHTVLGSASGHRVPVRQRFHQPQHRSQASALG